MSIYQLYMLLIMLKLCEIKYDKLSVINLPEILIIPPSICPNILGAGGGGGGGGDTGMMENIRSDVRMTLIRSSHLTQDILN